MYYKKIREIGYLRYTPYMIEIASSLQLNFGSQYCLDISEIINVRSMNLFRNSKFTLFIDFGKMNCDNNNYLCKHLIS